MIENATSAASIQSMLRTLAAHQAEAASGIGGIGAPMPGLQPTAPAAPGFGQAIERALEQVNSAQQKAAGLRDAYEKGESVPLTDVVIQMQKASLSFEATLQIRNKVMKAYEDILNMPV